METIPEELRLQIADYLSDRDYVSLSSTDRYYRNLLTGSPANIPDRVREKYRQFLREKGFAENSAKIDDYKFIKWAVRNGELYVVYWLLKFFDYLGSQISEMLGFIDDSDLYNMTYIILSFYRGRFDKEDLSDIAMDIFYTKTLLNKDKPVRYVWENESSYALTHEQQDKLLEILFSREEINDSFLTYFLADINSADRMYIQGFERAQYVLVKKSDQFRKMVKVYNEMVKIKNMRALNHLMKKYDLQLNLINKREFLNILRSYFNKKDYYY